MSAPPNTRPHAHTDTAVLAVIRVGVWEGEHPRAVLGGGWGVEIPQSHPIGRGGGAGGCGPLPSHRRGPGKLRHPQSCPILGVPLG